MKMSIMVMAVWRVWQAANWPLRFLTTTKRYAGALLMNGHQQPVVEYYGRDSPRAEGGTNATFSSSSARFLYAFSVLKVRFFYCAP